MKKIITLILLTLSIQGFSQRIIDKSVGDFHAVKVFDLGSPEEALHEVLESASTNSIKRFVELIDVRVKS